MKRWAEYIWLDHDNNYRSKTRILNDDGSLRAKVFNKENEFRYIGDELGYTQGVGLSYQVDFQTFRDLLSRIISKNK